jgi:hypothetical protein
MNIEERHFHSLSTQTFTLVLSRISAYALTEHLQIVIASNYSAIANSRTLQFTAAHTKSSCSLSVAW